MPTHVTAAYNYDQLNNELDAPTAISLKLPISLAPSITNNELSNYHRTHGSSTVSPIAGVVAPERVSVRPLFDRNAFYRNRPSSYSPYSRPNEINGNSRPYDGYTTNGFGYYLPRQYHEERYANPANRDGSYGYIDPFGIRRVVYYRTSADGGFKIRKNNRYVGFNATPYDKK